MKTITEAQYDELCDACDALLKQKLSYERMANAWLHVIREHPIFLNGYSALFNKGELLFYSHLFRQLLWHIAVGSYKFLHAIYRNYFLQDRLIKVQKPFEDVFISHFLNETFIDHKRDFYFFDLPKKIAQKKSSSLQLYINFTDLSTTTIQQKWKEKPISSKALPKYLSFFQEIKIRWFMVRESLTILNTKTSSKFEKRVKYQAAVASLSSSSHSNYRLAILVQRYVKMNNVKRIFTTYEGHPWEKLIYAFARKVNPRIKCIGYQHALVFRKQHAIRRKLTMNFEPDYILCSGEHGLKQFEEINYLPSNRLLLFGTNRTFSIKPSRLAIEAKRRNVFLMLSEGDLVECIPLVKFVLHLAKEYPKNHFIIRFHPITRVTDVLRECPELSAPPKNIELSSVSFEEDLERAHFAIYRGSTTIIKAVEYGLFPLYFSRPNEIMIDPLHGIHEEKISVSSPSDIALLEKITHKMLIEKQHSLIKHVQQFFSPINYNEALKIKHL